MEEDRGWFASNGLALLLCGALILSALYVGHSIGNQFNLNFSADQTNKISAKLSNDIDRVEGLGNQFSIVAGFLRLKFVAPIEFHQNLLVTVSRAQLAAGAALPLDASSHPKDEVIFSGTETLDVASANTDPNLCDFNIFEETFPVKELRQRVESVTNTFFPKCIKAYLDKYKTLGTTLSGKGGIVSPIEVSLDVPSKIAIDMLAIVLFSSLTLLLLKVFKTLREALYFRRKKVTTMQ